MPVATGSTSAFADIQMFPHERLVSVSHQIFGYLRRTGSPSSPINYVPRLSAIIKSLHLPFEFAGKKQTSTSICEKQSAGNAIST